MEIEPQEKETPATEGFGAATVAAKPGTLPDQGGVTATNSIVHAESTTVEPNHQPSYYMRQAIALAREAERLGDIPIGCVIVHEGEVIAATHNRRELDQDPLAHAELLALREAATRLGSWRLENAALYVTLEPCPMCAGAIILSRVAQVYYGASDPKAGCAGSLMNLLDDPRFNHRPLLTPGMLAEECGAMLTGFFRAIRAKKKGARDSLAGEKEEHL